MFFKKVPVIPEGLNGSFCWFLKHVKFLVKARQSGLPESSRYRKQSKILSILDIFGKKQWLWNQNRNYSIASKQSVSKPSFFSKIMHFCWKFFSGPD